MTGVLCGRCRLELPTGAAARRPIPGRFDDRRLPVCPDCEEWIDGLHTLERLAAGVAAVDRAVANRQFALRRVVDVADVAEDAGHPLAQPLQVQP